MGLLGCQNSSSQLEDWRVPSSKIKVLCTTPIIDDLVARIGGERIQHLSLMDRSMDPHSYELVKGDDEKFTVAKLVFCNGLGLEHSASLKAKLQEHPHAVALGDEIHKNNSSLILHHQGQADPHIWLDVDLWKKTIDPIVSHLISADPEGREYYEARGNQVEKELFDLDAWLESTLKSIPQEKRYLVTSHDAFNYFTRRYLGQEGVWKDRFCAPEGLAPDGQLGFQDLQRVIDHLQKNRIRTLFSETNVSQDSLKKIADICREKGILVEISTESLFSDTLADSNLNPLTYEEMMKHNALLLYEAWSRP
ncbi:MAG: zinc ABC transporter substrate-binding protein [Rhabdochlamydiaceae bacterium]|nr:zinc ABC transporter substrate-binding protein [Rhabdochlamydiaceae bacterium]